MVSTGLVFSSPHGRKRHPPLVADPLVRETEKLYGLPPAEFTAARNARSKALRKDDPELAAAVAKLPKPSVAAAALNELAREDPSEVRALVQSGKRLRAAQEGAVKGKRVDLDTAVREHRDALDRVQRDLRRRRLSGPVLDRATRTLRVASLDPELQPLLERGLLHEDLEAAGFGLDPGIVPTRPAARKKAAPKPKDDARERQRRRREAQARLREAEAALEEAQRRAKSALRDVERAEAEVERARRAVEGAG
jgi:hypothetical protein